MSSEACSQFSFVLSNPTSVSLLDMIILENIHVRFRALRNSVTRREIWAWAIWRALKVRKRGRRKLVSLGVERGRGSWGRHSVSREVSRVSERVDARVFSHLQLSGGRALLSGHIREYRVHPERVWLRVVWTERGQVYFPFCSFKGFKEIWYSIWFTLHKWRSRLQNIVFYVQNP